MEYQHLVPVEAFYLSKYAAAVLVGQQTNGAEHGIKLGKTSKQQKNDNEQSVHNGNDPLLILHDNLEFSIWDAEFQGAGRSLPWLVQALC